LAFVGLTGFFISTENMITWAKIILLFDTGKQK